MCYLIRVVKCVLHVRLMSGLPIKSTLTSRAFFAVLLVKVWNDFILEIKVTMFIFVFYNLYNLVKKT